MGYYLISSHHQCRVTNRRPDQTERARLGIICMRHTIASRCSKLCFCAIPSDKNHLCNGSLQQSKDVILRAKQNSEYLERMHFVFIIRIISTKFIVEKFFCKWSPAGRDSLSSCNYDSFFPSDLGVPAGPVSGSVDNSPGKSFFVNYMDHADGGESLFSTF